MNSNTTGAMRHNDFEQKFYTFLLEKGFPEDSLVRDPCYNSPGGYKLRPDIAIINPKTKTVLAVIELKVLQKVTHNIANQLMSYIKFFEENSVKGFLVLPGESDSFVFYTFDENNNLKECTQNTFFDFNELNIKQTSETISNLKRERSTAILTFKRICFMFSFFTIALSVSDFILSQYNINILTTERLALLGVGISLAVIPYVQKLKILGIEIDRSSELCEKE